MFIKNKPNISQVDELKLFQHWESTPIYNIWFVKEQRKENISSLSWDSESEAEQVDWPYLKNQNQKMWVTIRNFNLFIPVWSKVFS